MASLRSLAQIMGLSLKILKIMKFVKSKVLFLFMIFPIILIALGTIEKFHYSIKKYLGKEYINNCYCKLDFESIHPNLMNFYNNKIHCVLGMSPNEAVKITDIEIINKVNAIKKREFDKINNKRNYLQVNDICLLNLKFLLIGTNTLIQKEENIKKILSIQ